ncbi:YheC/YheD family protein [Cytobacillus firmus]|uniref:YheC/YheD family protein n=1 Tax=Cytobacillus firmus TaxID=1399 RepID=UPI001C8D64AA|nr:YheC/YheD family protein [Cytobacillus firmus]MBX9972596.1 YheC/YheD family protein [Cytobacillus firmus]
MDQNKPKTPVIGICISNAKREFQKLAKARLERYPGDMTLIRFHIKDLDFENLQVKGVYLEKKGREMNRKKGVFPLPEVIYLQCHVDDKLVKKIEGVIGRRVFNSFIFDKWECWDLLEKDDALRRHLPYTQKLENGTNLQQFLYNYEDIFLKPIDPSHGHSSKGIFRVKLLANSKELNYHNILQSVKDFFVTKQKLQKEGSILVTYLKQGEMQRESFELYKKFQDWILPKFSKNYIMQQSIQTIKWKEKVTDIRLNMNKNGKGDWEVSLLLLRVALNDSHCTPRVLTARPMRSLTKMFPNDKNMENIETAVVDIGFKICDCLDESGYHMADLGVDLGLDENGHLWVFEVNPLPHPLIGVPDHSMTKPLEYAAYLTLE